MPVKYFAALLASLGCSAIAVAAEPPWSERILDRDIDFETSAALDNEGLDALLELGKTLFDGKFVTADGAGRPNATQAIVPTRRRRPVAQAFQRMSGPDANACVSCHNEPVSGGAGAFTANVFVSEGFESADFDTSDPQFSNERGTTALQGAGLIELLAREMTVDLQHQRRDVLRAARDTRSVQTAALVTKGVPFGTLTAHPDGILDVSGIDGVDDDLVIRPFSQKGVFASLRQFTVNALNHHHGIQATERFGKTWTGTADFDEDQVPDEISTGQVSALVAFQAVLPVPARKSNLPTEWETAASEGEHLFKDIGCASCHISSLPLDSAVFSDPSPFDAAGTLRPTDVRDTIEFDLSRLGWVSQLARDDEGRLLVPLFGDLKRHTIADAANDTFGNELLGQRFVDRDVFLTAELWGVASTAPYGHRGDLTTLNEAILAHGGEASPARAAYTDLDNGQQQAIIAFLRSLEISQ